MPALNALRNPLGARRKAATRSPRPHASLAEVLRAHPRVEALEVESTDGWFVTLHAGWKSASDPMVPVHCFGASTLTEAMRDVRAALPCDCDQCRRERT
jgi:hypothetical protein